MTGHQRALERYEAVIGLEVHTHLATASKLFSPAPVRYGDPPNHAVSPIDLGMPGVLPVLNEAVVDLAIRFGLAIGARVNPHSVFARKNYFYPDLPKGYQISQFEDPVVTGGYLDIEVPGDEAAPETRRIRITRAHLEEDAGKSIHDPAVAGSESSLLDLNRAGVPLLEIVSEPDLRSAAEATAYLRALRSVLRYIGVSHADMEKGQFRCDANVSIRLRGAETLGTRTELKNINSFVNVEGGINAEIARQAELLDAGEAVVQATMAYDRDLDRTRVLRLKENSDDYRYFPDPDLIPLVFDEARIERVRAEMPELAQQKCARFQASYGLSEYDARLLSVSRELADFFEGAVRSHAQPESAKVMANWILRDVLRALKDREIEFEASPITPEALAKLIGLVDGGRLTVKTAQELLPDLVVGGGDPEILVRERGLEAVSDSGIIEAAVREVLEQNPEAVETLRGGDDKAINFLMGRVMKSTKGKADPGQVRALIQAAVAGKG